MLAFPDRTWLIVLVNTMYPGQSERVVRPLRLRYFLFQSRSGAAIPSSSRPWARVRAVN